jgi:WD40 repeat protein
VTDAAFSPDGAWIVTTHELGAIATWNAVSGRVRTWDGDNRFILRDTAGLSWLDWGEVLSTAFSPNDKLFLTAHREGMAKLWDVDTGTIIYTRHNHTGSIFDVVFSPQGSRFATTAEDGTAKIWDTLTGREIMTLYGSESGVVAAAFSPDGTYLATANGATVKLWDISLTGNQEWLDLRGHDDRITGVAYSPNGKRIVTAGWDSQLRVWDADTGKEEFAKLVRSSAQGYPISIRDAALSPDIGVVRPCRPGHQPGLQPRWEVSGNGQF